MILNVNDDRRREAPSLAALEEELQQLGPEEYAILGSDEDHYIQTYRNDDGTFILEYRDGSPDAHFGAAEPISDLAEIVRAFSFYMESDLRWKSLWDWQPVEFGDDNFLNHENSYLIGGDVYPKVACGSETYPNGFDEPVCPECSAPAGGFHAPGCSLEQCPCCGEANHSCGCD